MLSLKTFFRVMKLEEVCSSSRKERCDWLIGVMWIYFKLIAFPLFFYGSTIKFVKLLITLKAMDREREDRKRLERKKRERK